MIEAAETLAEDVGVSEACRSLGVPRRTYYRAQEKKDEPAARPTPPRALSDEEREHVRAVLNSDRFCDSSPRQVYAELLDEDGVYLCHWRTMYRVLEEHGEVRERRRQRPPQRRVKPELGATAPNQVWSWDITLLKGQGCFYYLYTIIDVFSRYVTGWMIANRESADLARKLITETCQRHGIGEDQLVLHSDRGSAMRSKAVGDLLVDLGVAKSYSRPGTPTDNPYSESQFKTMKYQATYPNRFESLAHARQWARAFFPWYNDDHHHSSLGLLTPATVHSGKVETARQQRQNVLDDAYKDHPDRFVAGRPTPPEAPEEVWINQPKSKANESSESDGLAVSGREPGAHAESRGSKVALDSDKRLAKLEHPLVPSDKARIFLPKLAPELCQSR